MSNRTPNEKPRRDVPAAPTGSALTRREIAGWSVLFGFLTILIHLPFLFRYDLYFQSGIAVPYLQAKRILVGDVSMYFWGADYIGLGPIDFLTAALFAIFGASIPMAGFVSLLFWAMGVGLIVAYFARFIGRAEAIGSGCALAVGVPLLVFYSTEALGSTYNQVPLYTAGFMWLAVLLLKKGPTNVLCLLTGLLMGWFWYAWKQPLVVWATIGVGMMLLPAGREFLRGLPNSPAVLLGALAFLVGYSPELLYSLRIIGDGQHRGTQMAGFFGIAPPSLMARNWYMVWRCLPTYFNADPLSRQGITTNYADHLENWESFPLSAVDTIGLVAAVIVLPYIWRQLVQSYRERNFGVFLMALCPVVNVVMVVFAAQPSGAYHAVRRYILPAGVLCVAWAGAQMGRAVPARRWFVAGVLSLMLALSLVHQYQLLAQPDQLADYKRTTAEIMRSGYKYGVTWYHHAHMMTALGNEVVVFGILDHTPGSPYQKVVMEQPEFVLVWQKINPPPFETAQRLVFGDVKFVGEPTTEVPEHIMVFGHECVRQAAPRLNGKLAWAPYRRLAVVPPSAEPASPQR